MCRAQARDGGSNDLGFSDMRRVGCRPVGVGKETWYVELSGATWWREGKEKSVGADLESVTLEKSTTTDVEVRDLT